MMSVSTWGQRRAMVPEVHNDQAEMSQALKPNWGPTRCKTESEWM